MITYDDLILTGRYSFAEGEQNKALCLKNNKLPISIKFKEFNYIMDAVIGGKCTRGYEIATGFGISSLAAGFGFKKTGGKLVTLDCYVEEKFGSHNCKTLERVVNINAEGYKSIEFLIKKYELENIVIPKLGWSPEDVDRVLAEEFDDIQNNKLDYVFIDGEHNIESIEKDILSIVKYINKNTIMFFHDMFPFFIDEVDALINKVLNRRIKIVILPPDGFSLATAE